MNHLRHLKQLKQTVFKTKNTIKAVGDRFILLPT